MTTTPVPQTPIDVARTILNTGKAIAPDRFPSLKGEAAATVLRQWAEIIRENGTTYPGQVWEPAVRNWCTKAVGDRMATPRDILREASAIRTVWYGDQAKRAELDRRRHARLSDREARGALPAGTTPETPADGRAAALAAANSPARRAMRDRTIQKLESVFHDPDATPRDRSLARIDLDRYRQKIADREARRQIGGAA